MNKLPSNENIFKCNQNIDINCIGIRLSDCCFLFLKNLFILFLPKKKTLSALSWKCLNHKMISFKFINSMFPMRLMNINWHSMNLNKKKNNIFNLNDTKLNTVHIVKLNKHWMLFCFFKLSMMWWLLLLLLLCNSINFAFRIFLEIDLITIQRIFVRIQL